jgi:hypothetical protein
MKDKLEQLYISACIGQWDSSTFADKAMEIVATSDAFTYANKAVEEVKRLKLDLDVPI